jgi:carboxylate-amine ligase
MKYKLFEVFGVELEYMITDTLTKKVKPIADLIFLEKTGTYISDFENGEIAWSNELVSHVIELKTNGPAASMAQLEDKFYADIRELNLLLKKHNAQLMPGGAHPFMDPYTETKIWPHEHNEVYSLYNRIFDCRGHGWANLQSTHINLPFWGDDEFARLHAAIRLIMPIIPALSASTPILDSKVTGWLDTRLEFYRKNQKSIPIIAGLVIPEPVYSQEAYYERIFNPIKIAIKPYDNEGILDHHFLNSRGAIARFDRGAIEIRIIDIQECPSADLAILQLIVAVLRDLCNRDKATTALMQNLPETALSEQFLKVIKDGENALLDYAPITQLLDLGNAPQKASDIWRKLLSRHADTLTTRNVYCLHHILREGTLATRMLKYCGPHPDRDTLEKLCEKMAEHLNTDTLFTA